MKRSLLIAVLAACTLAWGTNSAPIHAQNGEAQPALAALPVLTAATAQSFGLFAIIGVSPDHRWVASTICDSRKHTATGTIESGKSYFGAIGCDLQLRDLSSGTVKTITQGGDNSFPTWSPNGKYLAFLSDVAGDNQLYVWNTSTSSVSRLSSTAISSFSRPEWTADSTSVVLMTAHQAPSPAAGGASSNILSGGPIVPGADVTVYRSSENLSSSEAAASSHITTSSPLVSLDSQRGNLVIIGIDGNVRTIASNIASTNHAVAPDGSSIAYIDETGFAADNSATELADVTLVDLHSMTAHTIATKQKVGFGTTVLWAPQSNRLLWLGGPASEDQVSVYDVSSGAVASAAVPAEPNMFFETTYESKPVWSNDGNTYFILGSYGPTGGRASAESAMWMGTPTSTKLTKFLSIPGHSVQQLLPAPATAGNALIALTINLDTRNSGFYNVDLSNRKYTKLYEKQVAIDSPVETPDHAVIAFYQQSADQTPDVWMADTAFQSAQRVTHINPELDKYVFGKARMISWKTADGQLLHGALLLPSDYQAGRRYPMIVYPYGSSYKSHEINNFGFGEDAENVENLQTLATRGYAILLPDAPVHTGSPMKDIALTIMPGVDKAIALGYADPQRLGVMGHSYGGYTVMALIAQTHRFKAAISRAGFSDWTAIYSELMPDGTAYGLIQADGNQYGLGGGAWTVRDKFISNSPYYLFDTVTTPVLIIQGTADSAVAPYNADISFVALRHLHKDVAYAKYAGVDHTEGSWPFADQLDYMTRMVDWFNKYLCPNRPSETRCD